MSSNGPASSCVTGPRARPRRVLVEVSRYAMLADQTDEAIRSGREAVEIAEALGLAELVPSALINIGSAHGNSGDQAGGTADLERAIEIARETNHPDLGRAYNNLATMQDNFDRAYELNFAGRKRPTTDSGTRRSLVSSRVSSC